MPDWRDVKAEIEHYNTLPVDEIKAIVKSGIETEFWKWYRSRIALMLATAEASLLRGETLTIDSLVRNAGLSAVYKQLEQLFNTPEYVLAFKQQPTLAPTPKSAKIGRQ